MASISKNVQLDNILSRLDGIKNTNNGFMALCPAHNDTKPSLAINQGDNGRILIKCFAGCELEAILQALDLDKQDLFNRQEKPKVGPLTVESLAKQKAIPVEFLKSLGIKEQGSGILIPYGKEAKRQRIRTRHGFTWTKGEGSPVPYGLDQLPAMKKKHNFLILVEGESDSWALWFNDWPALGLPGANMAGTLQADHLKGFDILYVWQEPDQGGDIFIKGIVNRLKELAFAGDLYVIQGQNGEKDLADLLVKSGQTAFNPSLLEIIEQAEPAEQVLLKIDNRLTLSDTGNGQRLARHFGSNFKFIAELKAWTVWDKKRWKTSAAAEHRIKEYAKTLHNIVLNEAAGGQVDQEKLKEYYSWAKRCLDDYVQNKALNQVKSVPFILSALDLFDNYPEYLNVQNGTIDLKTGELIEHNKGHLITKIAGCEYNPEARSPDLKTFLNRVIPDQELQKYLQKMAGYFLSGSVKEQKLFFPFGPPASGKSTFLNLLAAVLGEYATPVNSKLLLDNSRQQTAHQASPELAKLLKIRLAYSSEIPPYCRFDEAVVNNITGNEPITARPNYKDPFSFEPEFKIILAGNNRPEISGPKAAIWRRLKPIPFNEVIPEEDQDPDLLKRLKEPANLEAFLTWAVEGCLLWQQEGLKDCEAVQQLTEEYRDESDRLKDWKDERCIFNVHVNQSAKDLYDDYKEWALNNGHRPVSSTKFGRFLSEDDRVDKAVPDGRTRTYIGIGLKTD